MGFPLDPAGRFHAPGFFVRERGGAFTAIDRERAHWICLNRAGLDLLRALPGRTFAEALDAFAAGTGCPRNEAGRVLAEFVGDLARREFLATEPVTADLAERARLLAPERLHQIWIVTNFTCNQSCRHCYAYERVARDRRRVRKEALLAMMDECRSLGAEAFCLTGGEPLLREDLLDLVAGATDRSRAVLFTNGTLVTEELAGRLARHGDRLVVQVSLEGPDERTNALLREKGSFARAMEGIRRLLRAGVRVGVSTTPTTRTAAAVPALTRLLAGISDGGRGIEYHHLIHVLDAGNARAGTTSRLAAAALVEVVTRCREALRQAAAEGARTALSITNDKIFEAIASHGPRKDMCGAGYTILGINADGMLHPCATTIHDTSYDLGPLLDRAGNYISGRIGRLWRESAAVRRIRSFTVLPEPGKRVEDLRCFHGGGCWYHMRDPGGDIAAQHPFYAAYETLTEEAILHTATKDVAEGDPSLSSPRPRIYSSMARARIACAGPRKTRDLSRTGIDHGYCTCIG